MACSGAVPKPDMFWAPINGGGGEKLSPPTLAAGAPKATPPPPLPELKSSPPRRSKLEETFSAGGSLNRSNMGAAAVGVTVGRNAAGLEGAAELPPPPKADEKSAKSSPSPSHLF